MAEELRLEIVTPEAMVFSDYVEEVTVPGGDGEFGALIGHAPLLSTVKIGELNFSMDRKKTYYAVGKGYAEVTARKVTLLLDSAEKANMIDIEGARKDAAAAESEISKMNKEDAGYEKLKDKLNLAETRIKVAEKA